MKRFWTWLKFEWNRPMTEHEFNSALAMAGAKRCECCGKIHTSGVQGLR